MSADNWQCPNCANVVSTLSAACDNCGYDRRTMPDPTRREPKTSPERAELQVSLLNEIGLTLTAVAKEQVAQAETLKTYKLSLEGIQGLLVDLAHSLDVIAEVQANSYDAVVTKFMHIEKRLAQIEERLERNSNGQQQAFALTCKIQESLEDINGAEFTQLKCLLDLTNKRLKALELGERPKPRKAGKRK